MDANKSPTVVLSSWDLFLLFHRVSPNRILISRIITRDPNSPSLRSSRGQLWASVEPEWSPLKLMFALLLAAVNPDKLGGFAQPNVAHLAAALTHPSTTKRQRKSDRTEAPSFTPDTMIHGDQLSLSTEGSDLLSDLVGDGFTVSLWSSNKRRIAQN